ncbi:MAG: CDP-diacylglycerol--glycerol-3-phosphate 3-phosphatidyltransferase [Labilithrix sp.]|nr:CDP-diacylglycerol--glycerol-3-phosphate 3-phosphatidyltransferase [Labilithrix sp.]
MGSSLDFGASMVVLGALGTAGIAFALASRALRARGEQPHFERLDTVAGLPVFGKAPLEVVYSAALPLGRGLAALGISANAVTLASGAIATAAAYGFATGHFGLGALLASAAALADALDGIIARATATSSKFGQVLDTMVDRYVEALVVGAVAFHVRGDGPLLVVALVALVGGYMVSYASSILRELGSVEKGAPMRRAHRLAYFLLGALAVPLVQRAAPDASYRVQLAPLVVALAVIGVVGNITAVQRLLRGARAASTGARAAEGSAAHAPPTADVSPASTPAVPAVSGVAARVAAPAPVSPR